jgi:hypothetical protein
MCGVEELLRPAGSAGVILERTTPCGEIEKRDVIVLIAARTAPAKPTRYTAIPIVTNTGVPTRAIISTGSEWVS